MPILCNQRENKNALFQHVMMSHTDYAAIEKTCRYFRSSPPTFADAATAEK